MKNKKSFAIAFVIITLLIIGILILTVGSKLYILSVSIAAGYALFLIMLLYFAFSGNSKQ